ncbi:MAG: hypothetical protein WDN28_07810 [Chthoniobacter sp.]
MPSRRGMRAPSAGLPRPKWSTSERNRSSTPSRWRCSRRSINSRAKAPTPASASRARTYRRKVNTIAAQTALTTVQRSERLRAIASDIDSALEALKR